MFSKSQALVFAVSILSGSLGRPFDSETHMKRVHKPAMVRAQVVRAQVVPAQVVPRDPSASCTTCTRTVQVTGTATASAAFTVIYGSFPTSTASPNSTGNFGTCTAPQIEFGAGFDNHTGTSFRPVDQVSYNTSSADDITVITDFICNALINTCGADLTAQATCAKAQSAAAAQPPQEGIDADAFNACFGFRTNFKNVGAISNTGDPITGSTSSSVISPSLTASTSTSTDVLSSTAVSNATAIAPSTSTSSHSVATHDTGPTQPPPTSLVTAVKTSAEPTEPSPTSAVNNPSSNNLQLFTGALGGIPAPSVVASGNNQFSVEGTNSLFNTKADALSRSCSNQQNDCSDAANASRDQGSLTVAACHTQLGDCNAANGT